MAAFLGIYYKSNTPVSLDVKKMLDDFSHQGIVPYEERVLPGMQFYFTSRFATSYYETATTISFISGHIASTSLHSDSTPFSAPEALNQWMLGNNSPYEYDTLEGSFVAIHYDKVSHTLNLFNDKFGSFPLFIYNHKKYIIFSNEYQPILPLLSLSLKELDYDAIAQFFVLGLSLGSGTFFKEIKNLAPANCLTVKGYALEQKQYWNGENIRVSEKSKKELAQEIAELFTEINREYLGSGLIQVCLLSAGADSRLILATMLEEQRKDLLFYTSNLSFLDETEDMDVIGAQLLGKRFGLKQLIEKISFYENQFDESYFDTARIPNARHIYGGWHGGEFLGGFYRSAAPISGELNYKEVDRKLKSIFSWRYRWKLKIHPYKAYLAEKSQYVGQHGERMFCVNQMIHSFFTSIYGGTRGHWLQPYQLTQHGFSPFWDSRFLQKLMEVPLDILMNYELYNEIFKYCDTSFTEIASNSPLTNRADSVLPKIEMGVEPKSKFPNTHHQAFVSHKADVRWKKRGMYNVRILLKDLANEQSPIAKQWLDFEVWFNRYFSRGTTD